MALRITELPELLVVDNADQFVVVDTDTNTTKRISRSNVLASAPIPSGSIANASITNAKLSTTAGEVGGSSISWTPSFTNMTVGNGSYVAEYMRIGKRIFINFIFTLGSTSTMGTEPKITLPTSAKSSYIDTIAHSLILDAGTARHNAFAVFNAANSLSFFSYAGGNNTQANITASTPIVWAPGDKLGVNFSYETA